MDWDRNTFPGDKPKNNKKERLMLAGVLAFILIFGTFFYGQRQDAPTGAEVVIEMDGEMAYAFPLDVDREFPIKQDGVITNLLIIQDGVADVIDANCPDHTCVNMKPISKNGETIVCLPNKVVVEVVGGEDSELDGVAQ